MSDLWYFRLLSTFEKKEKRRIIDTPTACDAPDGCLRQRVVAGQETTTVLRVFKDSAMAKRLLNYAPKAHLAMRLRGAKQPSSQVVRPSSFKLTREQE